MKQALYKKWWSYISDVHIESSSSDYNEILDLYLVKGRYQLTTANAIYSYGDKYDNFAKVFKNLDLNKINDVLVLGFGLASIPYILEKIHHKNFSYTGVEIDEEVVYLASKYVLDELKSQIHVMTTDAYTFLCMDESRYDLICMDVFNDDIIPEELETIDYLEMLDEALSKNGILIYNRLYFHKEDKDRTDVFFEEVFKKVFPEASYIDTDGNRMLLNKKPK